MTPERAVEPVADWDAYWNNQTEGGLYGRIASFYRRNIIRPALGRFARQAFAGRPGLVLHVGCGSGQVDADLRSAYKIVGVDLSGAALRLYRRSAGGTADAVRASALAMPFADRSVVGIYSLGLLEHFHEAELRQILREFGRVLAPNGRILLLWPPRFGPTVLTLNSAHFVVNRILRIDMKLHPDEVSLLRSRKHLEELVAPTGLGVESYYFGPSDAFTHIVCVLAPLAASQDV